MIDLYEGTQKFQLRVSYLKSYNFSPFYNCILDRILGYYSFTVKLSKVYLSLFSNNNCRKDLKFLLKFVTPSINVSTVMLFNGVSFRTVLLRIKFDSWW